MRPFLFACTFRIEKQFTCGFRSLELKSSSLVCRLWWSQEWRFSELPILQQLPWVVRSSDFSSVAITRPQHIISYQKMATLIHFPWGISDTIRNMPADREVRSQRNQRPRLGDRYRKRSRSLCVKARRLFFILFILTFFGLFLQCFSRLFIIFWVDKVWDEMVRRDACSVTDPLYSSQPRRSQRNEASRAEVVDGIEPDVKHLMQELQWTEHLNRWVRECEIFLENQTLSKSPQNNIRVSRNLERFGELTGETLLQMFWQNRIF